MAQTESPRAQVAALREAAQGEVAALADYTRTLDTAGWTAPTWCPGWDVREIVAHLAEGMDRFGQQVQGALAGQPVEFSMAERDARRAQVRALPDAELIDRLERNTAAFYDRLEPLSDDDLVRPSVPMAAGITPVLQVAYLRLHEPALHRWDVRIVRDPAATVEPHAAALLSDYVLAGAPRLAKADALGDGVGHALAETSGAGGGPVTLRWHGGQMEVARGAPATADVTLRLPIEALIRLIWGRLPLAALTDGTVGIEGDRAAAQRLATAFGNTR
ncbi:MAG TPA: maleylpyruvate isomerase family mycothiol-dependent enzyme [Chloroflexota bacterium]|nr:maleylpyruvate isomerase family mycothiol-dependent enzyme [Chloroflexota bacterium]